MQTEYKTSEQEIDEFKNIFWASRDLSNPIESPAIFLNISWDSAALDLKPIQLSHMQWFAGLINELALHGARNIVVRQHPDERFYPSQDNYEQIINKILKDYEDIKIKFYRASDEINSYELIQKSSSVFTFASTIGLEAAILKRPVFCAKDNYQSRLNALPRYIAGETVKNLKQEAQISDRMYSNAVVCYYFGQIGAYFKFDINEIDHFLNDKEFNRKLDVVCEQLIENNWSLIDV